MTLFVAQNTYSEWLEYKTRMNWMGCYNKLSWPNFKQYPKI